MVRARLRQYILIQPAFFRDCAQEIMVAPVVTISSTNKTFLPLSVAEFPKNALCKFLNLSSCDKFTCVLVSLILAKEF